MRGEALLCPGIVALGQNVKEVNAPGSQNDRERHHIHASSGHVTRPHRASPVSRDASCDRVTSAPQVAFGHVTPLWSVAAWFSRLQVRAPLAGSRVCVSPAQCNSLTGWGHEAYGRTSLRRLRPPPSFIVEPCRACRGCAFFRPRNPLSVLWLPRGGDFANRANERGEVASESHADSLPAASGEMVRIQILCRMLQLLSQLQPDEHLRIPFKAALCDSHLERPIGKSSPFSLRCGRYTYRDGMHINPELMFPILPSSIDVATVMNAEGVVERHLRHEAAAPPEPDAEHVHVGIGQFQTRR